MKKRIVSIMLVMCLLSLVACQNGASDNNVESTSEVQTEQETLLSRDNSVYPDDITVEMLKRTPNKYIDDIAAKYNLKVYVNEGESGITQDWNFAYSKVQTDYVTIAHQDDKYAPEYVENLLAYTAKAKKPLLFFTDYAEIRNGEIVTTNKILKVKRIMLFIMRPKAMWGSRFIRRRVLSLGSPICCPSATYYRPNLMKQVFLNGFRADEDWEAWERLSKLKGDFIFCNKILTYHRIHEDSETTKILNDNKRSEEDYVMYQKFWPKCIAKMLTKAYSKSEESNNMKQG